MFGIYHVDALFGDKYTHTELEDGRLVRALPERAYLTIPERLRAAWSVFTQKNIAVVPPEPGDFEVKILKGSVDHLVELLNKRGLRIAELNHKIQQLEFELNKQNK